MRMIVICFVLLAGLKVWMHDRTVQSVMGEALVTAYRERALTSCQKQMGKNPATSWRAGLDADAEIVIGNPNVSVALWDFDNPLWNVRYRHPHLVLKARGHDGLRCTYNIAAGLAKVSTQ